MFGIFGLSWGGYLYLATILVLWLGIAIMGEWLRYLAPIFLAGMSIAMYSGEVVYMGYAFFIAIILAAVIDVLEAFVRRISLEALLPRDLFFGCFSAGMLIAVHYGKIIYMLYALVGSVVLAAVAGVLVCRISAEALLRGILRAFRTHSLLIGGVVTTFVVMTATVVYLGGASPGLWRDFALQQLSFVGVGEAAVGGVSFERYAGEMAPLDSWGIRETQDPLDPLRITGSSVFFYSPRAGEIAGRFYNSTAIQWIVFVFIGLALVKICWSRKRWELLTLAWLFVLLGLVWPGLGQVRFDRQWWPFVAVMGGVGVGALVSAFKRLSREPMVAEWLAPVQKPLPLAFCASLIAMLFVSNVSSISFVTNAYRVAEVTTPPTEWHGSGLDEGFMEAFGWLRENTSENSVVAIEWSFGHVLTGTAERATVTDGCETSGEIGKWENDPIRPPDYIYRVIGTEGIFLERFVPREALLGRRSDMQWIFAVDKDELDDLLKLYRDNYDVRMDYLVFHLATPWTIEYKMSRPRSEDVEAETRSLSQVGMVFTFDFGEENVTFDASTGEVRLNEDDLIGYVLGKEVEDEKGNIYHLYAGIFQGHPFLPHLRDAGVKKILLIYFREHEGRIFLVGGALCKADEKPTVGTLICFEILESADYLRVVYRSQNGLVKVVKVNHVPSLISPAEDSRINNNAPTFQWSRAVGAARYEIWVDNDADFSSPEILENVSDTSHTSTVILADGIYSWRIGAFKADDAELGWSPTWTFTIDTTPPAAAILHAPENGATITDVTPTFEWTLGEGATRHRLLVDNNTDFSSPEVEVTLGMPENTHTSSELAAGSYWWKVIAIDDTNSESESPTWEFSIVSQG